MVCMDSCVCSLHVSLPALPPSPGSSIIDGALTASLFNAFLPSWLERKEAASHDTSQVEELQDFLFFTLAGIPGAVLGAVLVELPQLGQRRSMAL